jgi:hypothetical protein
MKFSYMAKAKVLSLIRSSSQAHARKRGDSAEGFIEQQQQWPCEEAARDRCALRRRFWLLLKQ